MPQVKYWYWPFWINITLTSMTSKQRALSFIEDERRKTIFHEVP